ncbi:MAG: CRISPR system Cascade subunit CasB [Rubritalea sp.]|jgi:CRISPR system Cascade subunit CasB
MYQSIYRAYCRLSKGDVANLKRCNLDKMANSPAYFRVLKMTGLPDNKQTLRVLFLYVGILVEQDKGRAKTVATALHDAGVKEQNIIQITRGGDNSIEYLKRHLVRCNHICAEDLGNLAQYWDDNNRRRLLKNYILAQPINTDKELL